MDRIAHLGFLIKDIARLYVRVFEQRVQHMGVTLDQCKALVYLSRNEGVSQIRLAELTGIDPMSLVRILDRMEGDGWIERRPHPTDRRARQLYVKPKAQPLLEQIASESDAVRAQTLAGLKAQERSVLIDLLERAHANLLEARVDEAARSEVQPSASRPRSTKSSRSAR
ncbi:MAG TPA: MarR family transcriptional regulator [Povalibacter sp.]|nr:MarR family transcriptional regulator [Povalibacter sp.]